MEINTSIPEKAEYLQKLQEKGFQIPDFVYITAGQFAKKDYEELTHFLESHKESYKIIVRSAHPMESDFKGGTFDSLETYADIAGIEYARNKIIKQAKTSKNLSILRQQKFNNAPEFDVEQMGVIVMPFLEGTTIMVKMLSNQWEFGYCKNNNHRVQSEPYITNVPHDNRLLSLSKSIQEKLGFKCEIEYIATDSGDIYVVQVKNISMIDTLDEKKDLRSIHMDGIRRIRKRHNYRERPIYIMDNRKFYIQVISQCEEFLANPSRNLDIVLKIIDEYEKELETFALNHQRFAVIGFSIQGSRELYQIANHYLDELPEFQKKLSKALSDNLYKIDYFLSEADTLLAKDRFRMNLGTHDAYGIDTVRNPIWTIFWDADRHDQVISRFTELGWKSGDTIGIEIDAQERPIVFQV